ncbi:MAG: hypothetical protein IRZ16_00715 [Myxococcaceae bacterium]|nr:hypothetical protein [Myxococcaceae bacterium]
MRITRWGHAGLAAAVAFVLCGAPVWARGDRPRTPAERDIMERPLSLKVGGGFESQSGDLAEKLRTGPMWSASISGQALPWLGAEATYTGSTHEVDRRLLGTTGGAVNGADFVHNGASVAATVNLPSRIIQPYGLAGIGFDRYNFRGANGPAFRDDTAGRVPLGAGLRSSMGALTADLRFNYNILFSQNFARSTVVNDGPGGTYDVGLNVGARF